MIYIRLKGGDSMKHRGQFTRSERFARSRLTKLLHDRPFLCGSLVRMQRVCGKQGCKCTRGELHPSLYLAIRVGEKRKMIHIPRLWNQRRSSGSRRIKRLGADGEDFSDLFGAILQSKGTRKGKGP